MRIHNPSVSSYIAHSSGREAVLRSRKDNGFERGTERADGGALPPGATERRKEHYLRMFNVIMFAELQTRLLAEFYFFSYLRY